MNQELQTMHQELQIAKQQNEIMSLRLQLEKVQAQKASRLEDSLFAPSLYEHYQKVSETLAKSGVIPTSYRGKPEDVFVAMAMGYQLGFPVEQSLQDIAVINGRPCLWGDGLLSLCLNHPDCEGIDEQPVYNGKNVIGFQCTVHRKNHQPHTQTFTMSDAERAGLLKKGGVWSSYPTRMLQMRARSLALRDKFADALRGLRIAEIEDDDSKVVDGEIIMNREEGKTQTKKLKEILKAKISVSDDIADADIEEDAPVAETPKATKASKTVHNTGSDDEPASEDQKNEIHFLMTEKGFDDARKKKALDYFKVGSLNELTDAQARVFLLQMDKAYKND